MAGVGELGRSLPGGEPGSVAEEDPHPGTLLPHWFSPGFQESGGSGPPVPVMSDRRYGARVATSQALSERGARGPARPAGRARGYPAGHAITLFWAACAVPGGPLLAAFPAGVAAGLVPGLIYGEAF